MKTYVLFFVACLSCLALGAQTESLFYQKIDCQTGTTMCFDQDSNLWLGCLRNNQPLLVKVDKEGVLLEQVPINMPFGQSNVLTELIIDSEGMLVGCGNITPVSAAARECSFVFRYNPHQQQFLWCRRMEHGFPHIRGIIEKNPGGHFYFYALNYALKDVIDVALINRQTGDIEPDYNRSYKIGNFEQPRAAVQFQGELYMVGGNEVVISGNGSTLQSVWKLDSTGNPQWTLAGSVPINQKTQLYGQDLLIEDNHIISISSGVELNNGNPPSRIFLQKTTLDGTLVWVKKYDIVNFGFSSETACDVVSVSDGFVILANGGTNNDYILKTDKNGNVQWAQGLQSSLDYVNSGFVKPQSRMMTDGKSLFILSATLENQQKRTVLIKTDLNGYVPGCTRLSPLNAVELPVNNPTFTPVTLQSLPSGATMPELAFDQPVPTLLRTNKDCQNEGPGLNSPCRPSTYALQIGQAGGPLYANCLTVLPDSNIVVAGQSGDSALLAAFSREGALLWTYTFSGLSDERLSFTSIGLDRDSLIYGCGDLAGAQGQKGKLAFRFDPTTAQLMWAKKLFILDPLAGGMIENTVNGHFQLFYNNRRADSSLAPQALQLDRNTGELVNLSGREYGVPGANQIFGSILQNSGLLVCAGQQQQGTQSNHVMVALGAAFGGTVWTALSRPDTAATAGFGGFDGMTYDDFHVITAYAGNPINNAMPPTRIYLQKTATANGGIAWIRYFDVPNVTDMELLTVPGAYVLLGRTGYSSYILIKTDRNGNLLLSKKFSTGGASGSSALPPKTQKRIALSGKYLFFLLTDDQPGARQSYLLKTDLNLEIAGACGSLTPFSLTGGSSKNLTVTPYNQPAVVIPLQVQTQPMQVKMSSAVAYAQTCPPVYIEPTPFLGADQTICSRDTLILSTPGIFTGYLWSDGSTNPVLEATSPGLYTLQATTLCGNVRPDTVEVFPEQHPERRFVVQAAPGFGVTLGNSVYFSPDTVVLIEPSLNGFCDTLLIYVIDPCSTKTTYQTISFYPGQTVEIDGLSINQPGNYVRNLQTVFGCDSLVSYTATWIITSLSIQCPLDLMDTAAVGESIRTIVYPQPLATTDCADSIISYTLLKGSPAGGSFPLGNTEVCYQASNACGIRDTCCFMVSVVPTLPPCDVKSASSCAQIELLDIQFNEKGHRRYRMRVTNNCSVAIDYVAFQLPPGTSAVAPLNGTYFESTFGNDYLVRNPNASPFYSIRFKAQDEYLKNGASDVFSYSLPQQFQPAYINAMVRFVDKTSGETHMSALGCPTVPWSGIASRALSHENPLEEALVVWPNPTTQGLHVQLSAWKGQALQLILLNAQGVVVLSRSIEAAETVFAFELPARLPNGLYQLQVHPTAGATAYGQVVLMR